MTQVADIIQGAYREINLVAIGKSPTAAQIAEGLTYFNEIVAHVLGGEAGNLLHNWPLGNYGRAPNDQILYDNWDCLTYPPPNVRLIVAADSAMTVYFPVRPSDGARMAIIDPHDLLSARPVTLDGNGVTIEGANTITLSTNGTAKTWLYRADLGNWVLLSPLTTTDNVPFPSPDYDPYFKILLALRLAAPAGRTLSDATMAAFGPIEQKFKARYYQSVPMAVDPTLLFTSRQSYRQYGPWAPPYSGSWGAWKRGWPW